MPLGTRAATAVAFVLAGYAVVLAIGMAAFGGAPTYYGDDWTWLNDIFVRGWFRGSVCNHFGHPVVLPNLHLLANYHVFDGDGTARAMVVFATFAASAMLVARLATGGLHCSLPMRMAAYAAFVGFACSGALYHKLWWSFGLTDALAFFGAALTALGCAQFLNRAGHASMPLLTMIAGGAIGTFSFGSGFAIWPAFAIVLVAARAAARPLLFFMAAGGVLVAIAIWGLPSCTSDTGIGMSTRLAMSDLVHRLPTIIETAAATLGYFAALAIGRLRLGTAEWLSVWAAVGAALTAVVVHLAVRIARRRERDPATIALTGLALMPVGAALLVGITRSGEYGAEVAFALRYAPLSMPLWLVLCALGVRAVCRLAQGPVRAGAIALLAMSAAVLGVNIKTSRGAAAIARETRLGALALLMRPQPDNTLIASVHRRVPMVLAAAGKLRSDRSGFFGSRVADAADRLGTQLAGDQAIPRLCFGRLSPTSASAEWDELVPYAGWVVCASGVRLSHLEAHAGSEGLVGLGLLSGGSQDQQAFASAGVLANVLASFPALNRTYSIIPGAVGLVRPSTSRANVLWTAVALDGRRLALDAR